MKKKLFAAVLLLALVAFGWISYSWTNTPYGKLDYRAALSLHTMTFTVDYQPDPNSDYTFPLPANLIYKLSSLLPQDEVFATEDLNASYEGMSVPVRVYWPQDPAELAQPLPVVVYFHGGGFVVGSVDIFDGLTRSLAKRLNAVVVSVEYRLAPQHPFPAAIDDAYVALNWVVDNAKELHVDPSKVFVGGGSAGGTISAVTALRVKQEGGPSILGQILYYPGTDNTGTHYDSMENFIDGYGLATPTMHAFRNAYAPPGVDRSNPYISPMLASSHADLPAALILTAGFDPLRDSGKRYAELLQADGVPVTYHNFPTTVHGFMSVNLYTQRDEGLALTKTFVDNLVNE